MPKKLIILNNELFPTKLGYRKDTKSAIAEANKSIFKKLFF